ncbi:High-affinity nickel-transporter [Streptomyces sp. WMMB 322]|uniref:High-affinity nickel-transporter n=1 Tax=Streptomyces sp. WMMB 322 TaxID=1286821 RepID=UPI000823E1A8|nr:High-affinity nickel-transporter [Streptomyces sp. WMMB 322]SCK06101.1 ABC-type nickel/cobalt efflux system, permease component RcnA [Streptomyces sp. WMMB 322]
MIQHSGTPLRVLMTTIFAMLICLGAAPGAHAHPLGNFSLNHHDGLRLSSGHIEDTAVVDSAEIPTAQDREKTDTDDDGDVSRAEAATRARQRCSRLAGASQVTVDSRRREWRVRSSRLTYGKGTAGLPIARLTCRLRAEADLSRAAVITFVSGADRRRTGWKEITATAGNGVRLTASSVPERSASAGLRRYPAGAADEPPNQTTASLRTRPGDGRPSTGTDDAAPGTGPAVAAGTSLFPALERELTALTTSRDLTLPVGLLGVLLTVLLGAGHAALPGHAKLAVAACLARRTGGVRAALTVGATVTATHTTGVLVVGLALTLSGSLLGDRLLGWLGTISGLIIATIGAWLVITAVRALNTARPPTSWHHRHHHPHDHTHAHGHGHGHGHAHPRPGKEEARKATGLPSLLGVGLAGGLVPSPSALVVLLGAVSLSRTFFGVLLVLGYGLGMAATLTAAGLLLSGSGNRLSTLAERRLPAWSRYTRYGTLLTALAVLTVGLALTLRSLSPL